MLMLCSNIANIGLFITSIKIAEKLTFYCENLSIAFALFLITKHARLPSLRSHTNFKETEFY